MSKRQEAAAAFNRCWELLELPASAERDAELIEQAILSRSAWFESGQAQQLAIADWMVSRAYAAAGNGQQALIEAEKSLAKVSEDFPFWLQASLFEGLARAQLTCGLVELAQLSATECRNLLTLEPVEENSELITSQLAELNI